MDAYNLEFTVMFELLRESFEKWLLRKLVDQDTVAHSDGSVGDNKDLGQ